MLGFIYFILLIKGFFLSSIVVHYEAYYTWYDRSRMYILKIKIYIIVLVNIIDSKCTGDECIRFTCVFLLYIMYTLFWAEGVKSFFVLWFSILVGIQ